MLKNAHLACNDVFVIQLKNEKVLELVDNVPRKRQFLFQLLSPAEKDVCRLASSR